MRIAVASGSARAREVMRAAVVRGAPRHQLAWAAPDGATAARRCAQDPPDMLLLDADLTAGAGADLTRKIMSDSPCGVLLVAAAGSAVSTIYEAMGQGALDFIALALGGEGPTTFVETQLLAKIVRLERVLPARRAPPARPATPIPAGDPPLIAIGSSTGGPQALAEILACFPAGYPGAVVIVQHVDAAYADGLTSWLSERTGFPVRLAVDGDRPVGGQALVAAADAHLIMRRGGSLGYTIEPSQTPYRPSVDVFFKSLAAHGPKHAAAALLTGMGADGAEGLKQLRTAGWLTIAQDRDTSVVYGMPRAAAEAGAASLILPLPQIGPALRDHAEGGEQAGRKAK